MSKYHRLSERLRAAAVDKWPLSFTELEAVLGASLPKAARTGQGWWANDPVKAHSRAWVGEGWEVGEIDPAAEQVVFRRVIPAVSDEVVVVEPAAPPRKLGLIAAAVAGVAVMAGLGALVARKIRRG